MSHHAVIFWHLFLAGLHYKKLCLAHTFLFCLLLIVAWLYHSVLSDELSPLLHRQWQYKQLSSNNKDMTWISVKKPILPHFYRLCFTHVWKQKDSKWVATITPFFLCNSQKCLLMFLNHSVNTMQLFQRKDCSGKYQIKIE